MRLIIDYFYASQLVGILATLLLILGILLLVTKCGPALPDKHPDPT